MRWLFRNARDAFDSFRGIWDELNKKCGNHILLDSVFVNFAHSPFRVGVHPYRYIRGGRRPRAGTLAQGPARLWETFQPSQTPLGLITFDNVCAIEE